MMSGVTKVSSSNPEQYLDEIIGSWYRIDRLVGVGGYAWVYHANSTAGKEVALKVLHSGRPTAGLRFDREIRVLRALPVNPSVAQYIDHGRTPDGRPFLALEYVEGMTLKASMRRVPRLPQGMAAELLSQICRAFSGLHELGVAHRDVKPANILLPRRGGIKLIDFGLIRDAQGLLSLLEETHHQKVRVFEAEIDQWLLAGTPEYMAPEQFTDALESDGPGRTDTWSDVFSLGVILFQLLTGDKPFPMPRRSERGPRCASEQRRYARWRSALTDAETPRCPGVDPALESILRRTLRCDPRQRQRDARMLEADLIDYLSSGSGLSDEESLTIPGAPSLITSRVSTERIRFSQSPLRRESWEDETTTSEVEAPDIIEDTDVSTLIERRSLAGRPLSLGSSSVEDSTTPMERPPSGVRLISDELPTVVDSTVRRPSERDEPLSFESAEPDTVIEERQRRTSSSPPAADDD